MNANERRSQEVFVVEHKEKRWVARDVGRILRERRPGD
jgi:hypothetical protein